MLRAHRSLSTRLGIFSVLKEELGKATNLLSHDLTSYGKFLTGEDISDKEKKIRQKHEELAQKDAAAAAEARKSMTWKEKIQAAKEELKNATRKNAAVVAMVQHCTRAHMAEVAVEQDIDIKNIHIITEGVKNEQGEEVEEKVVGYIDAPAATQEEVMAYAMKLEKACPAARTHGNIEWRQSGKPDVHFNFASASRNKNIGGNNNNNDDDFVFSSAIPKGSPFGNAPTHDDETQGDLVASEGKTTDKKKQEAVSGVGGGANFTPTNRGGHSPSDFARTAYDLSEAVEKAKSKTLKMEQEEEEKLKEEFLAKNNNKEGTTDINHTHEKESSSSKPIGGFASMKSMGLMNNNINNNNNDIRKPPLTDEKDKPQGQKDQQQDPIPGGFFHLKSTKPSSTSSSSTTSEKSTSTASSAATATGTAAAATAGGWFFSSTAAPKTATTSTAAEFSSSTAEDEKKKKDTKSNQDGGGGDGHSTLKKDENNAAAEQEGTSNGSGGASSSSKDGGGWFGSSDSDDSGSDGGDGGD